MIVYRPCTLISYEIHLGTSPLYSVNPTYHEVEIPYFIPDTGGFVTHEEFIKEDMVSLRIPITIGPLCN